MNICILGAGGLGSVLGAWLADSGVDVTLVARPAHVDAIRARGLQLAGFRGDLAVSENLRAVTSPDEATGDFDYLVLLVKAKDTAGDARVGGRTARPRRRRARRCRTRSPRRTSSRPGSGPTG